MVRQTIKVNAQVIIGQPLPMTMLVAFNEHLYSFPQELLAETLAILLVKRKQAFAACFFNLFFNLPFHARCGCALPRREAKDMCFGKLQFYRKLVGLLKITLALTGEACDDVGADSDARNKAPGCRDNTVVACAIIATCHAAQDVIRAALHWQVQVTAHTRIFPKLQPLQAKILRLQ